MSTTQPILTGFGLRTSNRRHGLRAGVALLFALTAVLSGSRAAAQVRTPTHVACVGDSITFGYGRSSPATASYPAVLQGLFGSSVQVRNFGVSGTTMMSVADNPYQNQATYTDATTFVSGAGATAVVDVIIMLGTNDSKSYNWMLAPPATRAAAVRDRLHRHGRSLRLAADATRWSTWRCRRGPSTTPSASAARSSTIRCCRCCGRWPRRRGCP